VHSIRGNGERETAEAAAATRPPAGDDLAGVTAAATASELGLDRARALGDLPLIVELDGVLYCHATPRADDEMVTRASTPARFAKVSAGVDARVVIAGHTHQQDDRKVGPVVSSTPEASACRTRAMGLRAGRGWSMALRNCARRLMTRRLQVHGCSRPVGPTSGRWVALSLIPSRRASSLSYSSDWHAFKARSPGPFAAGLDAELGLDDNAPALTRLKESRDCTASAYMRRHERRSRHGTRPQPRLSPNPRQRPQSGLKSGPPSSQGDSKANLTK
jgi:hypothetical protein